MSFDAYTNSGQGENRYQPLVILAKRDPVNGIDFSDPGGGPYIIDQKWLNTVTKNYWRYQGQGIWILESDSFGDIITITGDDSVPVSADPATGDVRLLGLVVANGTHAKAVFTESPALYTEKIDVQVAAAIAASDVTKAGLSAYLNTQFTVDSSTGFVQLIGGVTPSIQKIDVDAHTAPGTDPVVADAAGLITVTGGQVASGVVGTNVIRTDSLAVNTYTIEIQRTTTNATSDVTLNGVSHFNSADFTVDANGFVSGNGHSVKWNITSVSLAPMVKNNGYICVSPGGALTMALPSTASSTLGDLLEVTLDGATSWQITQAAGQSIQYNNLTSTVGVGGSITTTDRGNTIRMVYQATGKWNILSALGTLTVT